jgi:hypothetical protein
MQEFVARFARQKKRRGERARRDGEKTKCEAQVKSESKALEVETHYEWRGFPGSGKQESEHQRRTRRGQKAKSSHVANRLIHLAAHNRKKNFSVRELRADEDER